MAGTEALDELHFGEGGLLRRFESLAHLTTVRWQIVTAIAFTWVPVMLLGILGELITGQRELLLYEPAVHVRLLVAAPVFLWSDEEFPRLCYRTLRQLITQSYVRDADQGRFDDLMVRATRLADSALPELLLALLCMGLGIAAFVGALPVSGLPKATNRTPAQLWYALTDWPFYQFLFWRSLWRWMAWGRILFGLSRLDLALDPAHPDRRAGIAFLRIPSMGYCAKLLFATSSVVCAEYGARLGFGMTLESYKPLLVIFAAVGALFAMGPVLFFVPKLVRARRDGRDEFGGLATDLGRRVRRRVVIGGDLSAGPDGYETERLVESIQIFQSSTDAIWLVLFDKRDIVLLLVATLLPVLPVMLINVPYADWRELGAILTGGRLP
jgi:hypothetical protein